MSDELEVRIREVVAAYALASPPAPPLPEPGIVALRDHDRRRPGGYRAVAAIVLLFAVVASGLALRSGSDSTSTITGPNGPLRHQRIGYSQDASQFDCVADGEVVLGDFDTMVADYWIRDDGLTHVRVEYPDGDRSEEIRQDAWPLHTLGSDRGRRYRCAGSTVLAPIPRLMPLDAGATVVEDNAVDSLGRSAVRWRLQVDGFLSRGGDRTPAWPLTQIQEWYLDPETEAVLEVTWSDSGTAYGTVTSRTTLLPDEPIDPPDDLFDPTAPGWVAADMPKVTSLPTTTMETLPPPRPDSSYIPGAAGWHRVSDGDAIGYIDDVTYDSYPQTKDEMGPIVDDAGTVIGYWGADLGFVSLAEWSDPSFDLAARRAAEIDTTTCSDSPCDLPE